jgi:hypothetical protein
LKLNFPSLNALQCGNLESWLNRPKKRERERERERERLVLVMWHLQNMVFIVFKSTKQRDKGEKKVRLLSDRRDTQTDSKPKA